MRGFDLAAWVALLVAVGLSWNGYEPSCLVRAAEGSQVPRRGHFRQEGNKTFCESSYGGTFDGDMEQVKLLHPKRRCKICAAW
jgi:hypothetical protein